MRALGPLGPLGPLVAFVAFALSLAGCPKDAPSPGPVPWVEPRVPRCSYADVLTRYDYDALKAGGYCAACKDVDDSACDLDWPSSDVPSCALLDELRNEIFAYYGRPFEKERWRTRFAAKTWYAPSGDYSDARLTPIARGNVAKLVAERARYASTAKETGDASCAE